MNLVNYIFLGLFVSIYIFIIYIVFIRNNKKEKTSDYFGEDWKKYD